MPAVTVGQHLALVHAHFRDELAHLRDQVRRLAAGAADVATARAHLNQIVHTGAPHAVSSACRSFCVGLAMHHLREDSETFPGLREAEPRLARVLARIEVDHRSIQGLAAELDARLVGLAHGTSTAQDVQSRLDRLATVLLAHFDFEEQELDTAMVSVPADPIVP